MKYLVSLFLLISLWACNLYPDDNARVDEFDAVITYYDRTSDFSSYKTYAIIDSVHQISPDNSGQPNPSNPVSRYSNYIIQLLNTNLQSRGYVKVNNPNDADIVINAGIISTTNIVFSGGYPPYYWGCPTGWCSPGYWWGYPGYDYYYPWFPVSFVTQYEVGTLIIDLIDNENFNPSTDDRLLIKWTGIVRGVTGLTDSRDIRNRLKIDIDIAFEQSPYLLSNE